MHVKKEEFIKFIDKSIEVDDNISWNNLQCLKRYQEQKKELDIYDMTNFIEFFKRLYQSRTLQDDMLSKFEVKCSLSDKIECELNSDVSIQELEEAIRKLNTGKAVSTDGILNKFLINANPSLLEVITKIFNSYLTHGCYPWNTSLITPLHKKGDRYDPNNYRAIAIGSNLGKLFSSILLNRLLRFRENNAPNLPNQQGFCKGGQTLDHILCLNTCINKYTAKKKGYLFACFVDYAKAFHTVCREALIYKLHDMRIKGRFLMCLQHMYSSSNARIKLLGRMSRKIDIFVGTEQGHPLYPELFNIYIHDLSVSFNNIKVTVVPLLNNKRVPHLHWADNLVLLALNKETLQKQLDVLFNYCVEWGLSVNMKKTAVMVFNKTGRILNCSRGFTFNNTEIDTVNSYCYLSVMFTLSRSFKHATNELRHKANRGDFALRNVVDWNI